MTEELKPCPFCGGEGELVIPTPWDPYQAYVRCKECGVNGAEEWKVDGKDFKQRAIKKWNKRVKE